MGHKSERTSRGIRLNKPLPQPPFCIVFLLVGSFISLILRAHPLLEAPLGAPSQAEHPVAISLTSNPLGETRCSGHFCPFTPYLLYSRVSWTNSRFFVVPAPCSQATVEESPYNHLRHLSILIYPETLFLIQNSPFPCLGPNDSALGCVGEMIPALCSKSASAPCDSHLRPVRSGCRRLPNENTLV